MPPHISCGVKATSSVLFALNILFNIFGVTLLGLGIYVTVSKKFDLALSDHINAEIIGGEAIQVVGIILIIVGIFTFILSTFGCLGALFKNRVYLYSYTVILSILMIIELAAFITLMSSRVRIRDSYQSGLSNVFTDAYKNNRTDLMAAIDEIQREFECCGVNNSTDYKNVNRHIPLSCFKDQQYFEPIFGEGCADTIIDWMWDKLPAIGGVIGALLFIEIFGIIASVALVVAISHSSYGQLYGNL